MITLLVMTDGRDHIFDTVDIAKRHLIGPVTRCVIHDDSGDPDRASRLRDAFPAATVVATPARSGFGGAMRSAWQWLRDHDANPWIFHLEDDFALTRDVDLASMADVMTARPHIVQMALRRQPWNANEIRAGGIVEQHPHDYTDHGAWLEHRKFFTTNPSLYARRLYMERDWPTGRHTEGRFGIDLFAADPDARSAYWGTRESGEWCRHLGHDRVGTGY